VSTTTGSRRTRRIWWIASGAAVLIAIGGLGLFAGTHLAWGTTVNGIAVGSMTTAQAHTEVTKQLRATKISLRYNGSDLTVSLGKLGAEPVLKTDALDAHTWFNGGEIKVSSIRLDQDQTQKVIAKHWSALGEEPTEPTIHWDNTAFVVTQGKSATGVNLSALQTAVTTWFQEGGKGTVSLPTTQRDLSLSNDKAASLASTATKTATEVTLVGGTEKTQIGTVPAATVASWTKLKDGSLTYDAQAIQKYAATLPETLDHSTSTQGTVVVDSAGKVLQTIIKAQNAVQITSTDGLGTQFASSLQKGTTALEVPATVTPGPVTKLLRRIDVNLTSRVATLYENDQVVKTFPISSGKEGFNTNTGNFKIYLKYVKQTMDGSAYGDNYNYVTPDVPWVSYFNGGEAFHGAPWNNQIGTADLSHGCVNMKVSDAQFIYNWAPLGTEVHVHK
jgi:lipoprotein-anchoring transpeptidase ErfK/SrfK